MALPVPPNRVLPLCGTGGLSEHRPSRRLLLTALAPLLLLGTLPSAAAPSLLENAVGLQVRAALRVSRTVGVDIVDLADGNSVYRHEAELPRIIASNTKLLTTAAALDTLGPGYLFETPLWLRGEVVAGALHGDLAVTGGADPNLSGRQYNGDPLAVFRPWAEALAARGIRRVEGRLILVDGLFDAQRIHPDWPRDQLTRWYEAPVGALSFNDNCVLVRVRPHGRANTKSVVEVIPDLPLFTVLNEARTTDAARQQAVGVSRRLDSNVLRVSGRIYRRSEPVEAWVTVRDPAEYFGAALRMALSRAGITIAGGTEVAEHLGAGAWERVGALRSDLLTALEVTNKVSQNFFAEILCRLLGARRSGKGSWSAGVEAVEEFLTRVGIAPDSYSLADGSGMSRNNKVAPAQLTKLLVYMFSHPWKQEFLLSLAHSGERGLRWERRLATAPYRDNVFAKTGTLNGVSSLSGYAKARSGKTYAFSILCNGTRGSSVAQRSQDAIVRALIDNG